jgi:hypothetical protein
MPVVTSAELSQSSRRPLHSTRPSSIPRPAPNRPQPPPHPPDPQFVEKDPKLADPVLRQLLKFWPVTNSQKEVLFLGELEEILELTQPAEFQAVLPPLFRQLARCLTSAHFQVAERSLFLWNNEYIVSLVAQFRYEVLPMVFGPLQDNANSHWNPAVHGLTLNVRKMFMVSRKKKTRNNEVVASPLSPPPHPSSPLPANNRQPQPTHQLPPAPLTHNRTWTSSSLRSAGSTGRSRSSSSAAATSSGSGSGRT